MLNQTLPVIKEKAEELLALRQQARDERRRECLHALWLLASGAENNRTALARRLGRNRESVSTWLKDDAQGGLEALLQAAKPCGRPNQGGISLPAEVREAISAQLSQTQGQRGYQALWRWAQAEHALASSYSHFHRWARYHLGAKLKVARKSHAKKKEGQLAAFHDGGLKEALAAVQAAHPGQRVRLWAQDESRFGRHTSQRRRLTLPGLKPVRPFEQSFQSFWLCGAVEPQSGASFVLELPATDHDCLQVFLDQFAAAHAQDPAEVQVLLLDNSGPHRAKALRWPERVACVSLPAYCPELNPIERWWQELKSAASNTLFGTLAALRTRLDTELQAWTSQPAQMRSLTSYPYIIEALNTLG